MSVQNIKSKIIVDSLGYYDKVLTGLKLDLENLSSDSLLALRENFENYKALSNTKNNRELI